MASGEAFTAEGLASTKWNRILTVQRKDPPAFASTNSKKEELCLEYVENFRRQFVELFPSRRQLLLTAKNEAGVDKFVSTTLRPTQVPFKDMYDMDKCASFLADFIEYEPLPDPERAPEYLPSPLQVMKWRRGDCFDLSMVLVSYLIGNGYDAYCVFGTAPRWITLRETMQQACPFVDPEMPDDDASDRSSGPKPKPKSSASAGSAAGAGNGTAATPSAAASAGGVGGQGPDIGSPAGKSKYLVESRPPLESKYLKLMEDRRKKEAAEAKESLEDGDADGAAEAAAKSKDPGPIPAHYVDKSDPLLGRRVHCWVLVRAGRRSVESHVFIEPSTGRIFPVDDSPYETIESVWNHRNFWVNMQSQLFPAAPGSDVGPSDEPSSATVATRGGDGTSAGRAEGADAAEGAEGSDSKLEAKPSAPPTMPPSSLARAHAKALSAGTALGPAGSGSSLSGADDGTRLVGDVTVLSFDLSNPDNWEYVFIETASLVVPSESKGTDGEDGMDAEGGIGGPLDDGGILGDAALAGAGAGAGAGSGAGIGSGLGAGAGSGSGRDLSAGTEPASGESRAFSSGGGETDDGEHILDVPPSWLPQLTLSRDDFLRRFSPSGSRTTFYYKAKLEQHAPHVHREGLVARCTYYSDIARTEVERVVEVFASRADKLAKRIRLPLDQTVEEYFEPGRPSGLRLHIEQLGVSREMHFFVPARIDGLRKRVEIIGRKITEWYDEGPDSKLQYRSVTLMPPEAVEKYSAAGGAQSTSLPTLPTEAGELPIVKMTEKFGRSPDVPAEQDPARRTYLIEEQTIQVQYHHAKGRITASSRLYTKHNSGVELTTVDPFAPPVTQAQLDADFRAVIQAEKDCIGNVKTMQRAITDLIHYRSRQEQTVHLEKTVFEVALERAKSGPHDDTTAETAEEAADSRFDFLAPFLQFVQDPKNITKAEAQRADRECRKALKERLIERVNIIQRRLDAENEKLQKKQQEFQRNRDQVEGAEEEFEKFCAEAMFRIGILEQRLQRQEETVMAKYVELERQLKTDPRLAVLQT